MIEKLENNEQILLMYLADELPGEDRADVERMLMDDPSLRRHLAELQGSQAFVMDELARLDELSALPVSVDFAARQVGRAMRQQLARPKAPAAPAVARGEARSWWWFYPTVAAASVMIVAMVWLQHQSGPSSMPGPGPVPHMNPGEVAVEHPSLPSQTPVAVQNSRDSDDALLLDSLKSPVAVDNQPGSRTSADDDPKRLALNDAMPQDEVSQYLLSAAVAQ